MLSVFLIFRYFLPWLAPFLLALALAAAIEPAVGCLEQKLRLRRSFASAVLTLFLLFLLGGIAAFFGVSLLSQAKSLLTRLPSLLATLPELFSGISARIAHYGEAIPLWLRSYFESFLAEAGQTLSAALSSLASFLLGKLGGLAAALPRVVLTAATALLAVYFSSSAYPTLRRWGQKALQKTALAPMLGTVRSTLFRWFRAQMLLFSLTFLELFIAFLLLRVDFALLLAFLIALVDLLPVLGTGTVLIPWALLTFLLGSAPRALGLVFLYLLTLLVRNITEPRLLAAIAGVPPIASLTAMYLGFCTFGVGGMVLFPLFLLLFCNIQAQKKEGQ